MMQGERCTTITTRCAGIGPHSKRDDEAYDRYSRDVMRSAKFIKAAVLREPPDPTSFKPRTSRNCCIWGAAFTASARSRTTLCVLDHERRISRRVFRERNRQGAFRRQFHHRTALGPVRRARNVCCITTWAISTTPWRLGLSRAAAWRISKALGASLRQAADDPQRRAGSRGFCRNGRRPASRWPRKEIRAPLVISNMDVSDFLQTMDARIGPMNS